MMVNDVVNSTNNPAPGTLINQPNGTDVYNGIKLDYSGKDVSSRNFLNILKGNKKAMSNIGSGRVIKSGPRDNIFINIVDHGSAGLLAFPNDLLYADKLINALKYMYAKRNYHKIVFYIEACEAGSMFDGLLDDEKSVIAITASGPRESSYGYYCGVEECGDYNTCLGDLFSISWMENLDEIIFETTTKSRTIFRDFEESRTAVTQSNVMVYGDFHVGYEKLSSFIGFLDDKHVLKKSDKDPKLYNINSAISSREITEIFLQRQLLKSNDSTRSLKEKILLISQMKSVIDATIKQIYEYIVQILPDISEKIGTIENPESMRLSMETFQCYRSILNKITEKCFSIPKNPYLLKYLVVFANICVIDKNADDTVIKVIDTICSRVKIPKNLVDIH
ncbi:legumain-like isoform X2 [Daktulosphaira vitifoliae]|nr:legumain-like isoform X2 [Daktulosphaira vitifoliae]